MKIVHIIPGTGGAFYCGNCLRDSHLVKALRTIGHDVIKVPMYLPLGIDEAEKRNDIPVFFGAINLYLKQQFPFFKKAPRFVERIFNSSPFLNLAAKMSGSTEATGLEDMTISMLKGEEGNQADDLEELVEWLVHHEKPDVIHLANGLLLGLVKRLKARLDVPIVCSLQDEDVWIDEMDKEFAEKVWDLMAERALDVDMFIPVSQYYAEKVKEKMRIASSRMQVIHIGIDVDGYEKISKSLENLAIGYLSRLHSCYGFDILVDAFIQLKKETRFKQLKLRATGGITGSDKKFIADIKSRLRSHRLLHDVDFIPHFDKQDRLDFFKSINVMSVPMIKGEAFGIFLLEALAAGIPLVQPKAGAFPEVIAATGGGVIYDPNDAKTLADALRSMLLDSKRAQQLGGYGRREVFKSYTNHAMAERITNVYRALL